MLPLHDPHLRLALLNHLTVRMGEGRPQDLEAVGIEPEQVEHLRRLSADEMRHLASMHNVPIVVDVDAQALRAGLRTVAMVSQAKAQETYFLRHGASVALMLQLFRVSRELTLKRRRILQVQVPSGRVPLPDEATRERIRMVWRSIEDPIPRVRYLKLHQAFPSLPFAVLEAVLRASEVSS